MKGMIIGIVVLIALIILAILFFSGRRAGAAAFGAEVGMQSVNSAVVRGKDGWCGTVLPPAPATGSDPAHVRVQLENGEHYLVPAAVVIPQPDGSVYVPLRVAELVPAPREEPAETIYAVVPVLAEDLEVQKGWWRPGRSVLSRWSTNARPLLMNPCGATTSPSHVCRCSVWWMAPCPCVRRTARRLSPSWKRCWSKAIFGDL